MSLTIVISGPRSSEPQARTALASQGYVVQKTVHDHGFPSDPDGNPEAFVTCITDEDQLDAVAACAQTLGYRLRLHHETPPTPEPSPEMLLAATLADMRREINELKARVV